MDLPNLDLLPNLELLPKLDQIKLKAVKGKMMVKSGPMTRKQHYVDT